MVRGVIEVIPARAALFGRVDALDKSFLIDDGDVKMTFAALIEGRDSTLAMKSKSFSSVPSFPAFLGKGRPLRYSHCISSRHIQSEEIRSHQR